MGEVGFINLENPSNPFEEELVGAMTHAELHLIAGYQQSVNCGLMDTQAKSQGMMVAITRVLGHHLCQHHINMLTPIEDAKHHVESIVKNLQLFLDDNYPAMLEEALVAEAARAQKQ